MTLDTLSIDVERAESRLDKVLSNYDSRFSRAYFQYLIDEGHVLVNGSVCKKKTPVKPGDTVLVSLAPLPEIKVAPEKITIDILYEDDSFVAINKPSGMVTHPAPGSPSNSVVGAVLYYLGSLPESDDPLRPGIIHRLDKDTSGVILIAKSREAHAKMSALFAERQIEKVYLAICHSKPSDTFCSGSIGRHPKNRQKMAILADGKEAFTRVEVLETSETMSIVRCFPKTGRTHQIRVHLQHLKAPICGDPIYGPKPLKATRTMLHASELSFLHPFTGQKISITAPLPNDMESRLKAL